MSGSSLWSHSQPKFQWLLTALEPHSRHKLRWDSEGQLWRTNFGAGFDYLRSHSYLHTLSPAMHYPHKTERMEIDAD